MSSPTPRLPQSARFLRFKLFLALIVLSLAAIAQPSKGLDSFFQSLVLTPKFAIDPQILKGISGGGAETTKIAGRAQTETGECIGFVDTLPDHKITLTSDFKFLQLKVLSPGDTVLLIKGPGGSWCNDDANDRNPAIAGEWQKGIYEIWIGSYEVNSSYPYLLQISEKP